MSKKCQKCGSEMADSMNFCPNCHAKYGENPAGAQAPSAAPVQTPSVAPAQTPFAPAQTPSRSKKIWSAIGGVFGLLCVICIPLFNHFQPKLLAKARAENLQRMLVSQAGYKEGSVEVRHVSGQRFGVLVIDSLMTAAHDGKKHYYGKDYDSSAEPSFYMVLNEKTNQFEPASDKDRKALHIYSRVSNGDTDALMDLFD